MLKENRAVAGRTEAVHADDLTVQTDILIPTEIGKCLDGDSLPYAVRKYRLLICRILTIEGLHVRHGNDTYLLSLCAELCLRLHRECDLGTRSNQDILRCALTVIDDVGTLLYLMRIRTRQLLEVLSRQDKCRRTILRFQRHQPCTFGLRTVTRTDDIKVRDRTQHRELLDRLMGWAVFTDTDGIVGQYENLWNLHQRGQSRHRLQIVAEDEEGRHEGTKTAMEQHTVCDTGHRHLTNTEVDVLSFRCLRAEVALALHLGLRGRSEIR